MEVNLPLIISLCAVISVGKHKVTTYLFLLKIDEGAISDFVIGINYSHDKIKKAVEMMANVRHYVYLLRSFKTSAPFHFFEEEQATYIA